MKIYYPSISGEADLESSIANYVLNRMKSYIYSSSSSSYIDLLPILWEGGRSRD